MTATQERHPTRIATLSALLVVSAYVAGKAGREAILLSRFSIESLPLFIGLSAALSLPVILLTGRLMVRFGPARLIPIMNVVSGGMAIGEYLLLGRYPQPIAVVVFFHLSTASAVLVSGFWSIVNERFDIQSAKRHIGRIGLGATLGGILGGVVAERSAVYFERDAILLVLAGLQLTCAFALVVFGRGAKPHPAPTADTPTMWASLKDVSKSKLLRNLSGVVILSAVAAGIMDYVFKADITNAAGAEKGALLRSLALFYTITNIVTAVVQIAVCGPVISALGVPRSVASLPTAVTGFGIVAAAIPSPIASAVARGAELVTRNSIYRAGYELLYAPLPDEHKRPTKVVIDVGADKIGDILGAQLVGAIVWIAFDVRTALLIAAIAVGGLALLYALRLPKAYTKALEDSLMTHAAETAVEDPALLQAEPWFSLTVPGLGEAGDLVPLRMRPRAKRQKPRRPAHPSQPPQPLAQPPSDPTQTHGAHDPILQLVRELRSEDASVIRRAFAQPMPIEFAAHAIELVGRDDVAREACAALVPLAPKCTGLLVDALLDLARPVALRRRLPTLLAHGEPQHASWGLWRGLADESFEVRSRCGRALARLAADGKITGITPDEVFATVRREIGVAPQEWRRRQIARDVVDDESTASTETALEHVFQMLGLVLPPEPLRIAMHALQASDTSLRGMALEYLESILPPDVRAQLWPLLESEDSGAAAAVSASMPAAVEGSEPAVEPAPEPNAERKPRSQDELIEKMKQSLPAINLAALEHELKHGH